MPEFLKTSRDKVVEFFKKMSKRTRITLAIVVVAIIAFSVVTAYLLNRVNYAVLYTDLSSSEAGQIMTELKTEGVDAKMSGTDTILVPADKRDDLIVSLASSGYPKSGLTYDIFKSASFGATDEETKTLEQYQLQENIRTTINNMDKVKDCTVLISLASSSSYVQTSNATPATAAIVLQLEDGKTLSDTEAKTIANILMGSVPKITLDNIKITDTNMTYYNLKDEEKTDDSSDSNSNLDATSNQIDLTEKMKALLKTQVQDLISTAVGKDNLAVSVGLTLNFDNKSSNSVEFSPPVEGSDNGIVRSSQQIRSALYGTDGTTGTSAAGTSSNGVSASQYVTTDTGKQNSYNATDTYNYEINEVKTQLDKVGAKVDALSVSILVNSSIDGMTSSDNIQKIKNLAADAIGVDPNYISVETMAFSGSDSVDWNTVQANQKAAMQSIMIRDIAIAAIVGVAVILAIFLVLRFLHKRNQKGDEKLALAGVGQFFDATLGDGAGISPEEEEDLLQNLMENKSSELERVEAIVEKYPEVAAQIIRTWLNED
jgi:flagellar M-ring protein FliF